MTANDFKVGDIWEFDNEIAYGLSRVVAVKDGKVAVVCAGKATGAHYAVLINPEAPGWRKIAENQPDISFKGKLHFPKGF